MALLKTTPVRTEVQTYPLAEANQALRDLREGRVRGAAVLVNQSNATTAFKAPATTCEGSSMANTFQA